jgi:hypothetical protein
MRLFFAAVVLPALATPLACLGQAQPSVPAACQGGR